MNRILVIKHGALGDVVLATAPFAAIRSAHRDDHITLLTTRAYAPLLGQSGYFDEIWIDDRPRLHQFIRFFRLIRRIRSAHFTRIYDLQTSERTEWYHRLLGSHKPEWVGTAPGASHRHDTPERTTLHTIERHKQQMGIAGIRDLPPPNLDWLHTDIAHLPEATGAYALIVAGGSSHRPGKRWPAHRYGDLCNWLLAREVAPLLLGTEAEASVISTIESISPGSVSLLGRTGFAEITMLARSALFAVGNDTGPMHLIAATGCPSLVLFSEHSNPALCAPRGPHVQVIREMKLANLPLGAVTGWAERFIRVQVP